MYEPISRSSLEARLAASEKQLELRLSVIQEALELKYEELKVSYEELKVSHKELKDEFDSVRAAGVLANAFFDWLFMPAAGVAQAQHRHCTSC